MVTQAQGHTRATFYVNHTSSKRQQKLHFLNPLGTCYMTNVSQLQAHMIPKPKALTLNSPKVTALEGRVRCKKETDRSNPIGTLHKWPKVWYTRESPGAKSYLPHSAAHPPTISPMLGICRDPKPGLPGHCQFQLAGMVVIPHRLVSAAHCIPV